jgi:multidrug resistance efflux pump
MGSAEGARYTRSMRARRLVLFAVIATAAASAAVAVLHRADFRASGFSAGTASPLVLPAVVQPQALVNVMAPIEGTIAECFVAEGQRVEAGEVLARLESSSLSGSNVVQQQQARLARERSREADSDLSAARIDAARLDEEAARAQSAVASARSAYQKQKALFQNGVAPRLEFENAERTFRVTVADSESLSALATQAHDRVEALSHVVAGARGEVEELEKSGSALSSAELEVRAPVGGIVVAGVPRRGDAVDPATRPVFRIAADLQRLDAMAAAPLEALRWLRPGLLAEVEIPGPAASPLRGVVREVGTGGRIIVGFQALNSAMLPGTRVRLLMRRPSAP